MYVDIYLMWFLLQFDEKQRNVLTASSVREREEPAQRREARERVSELRHQLAQSWVEKDGEEMR